MTPAWVAVGAVGTVVSLLLLYLTTGVLLHFVAFDRKSTDRYMERLRTESSFEAVLGGTVFYAVFIVFSGVSALAAPAYTDAFTVVAFTMLVTGLLYFLYRMHHITRPL